MQKDIKECLQYRMNQAEFSRPDQQRLLDWTLSQNMQTAIWPRRVVCLAIILLALLAMMGFVSVFTKGYIPDFFLDRSLVSERLAQVELYNDFIESGKLMQLSEQLEPGEIGTVAYRNIRGSLEAIVLRGDTLDAVIPSYNGEAATSKAIFYHDPDTQYNGGLSQDWKSNDIQELEGFIENGDFVVCLPAERYEFQWIASYSDPARNQDYISMIGYQTLHGQNITMIYRPTSDIYRDLEAIRGEDVEIADRQFVFVTSDKSFETIEEIYYFFDSDYEQLIYSHVVVIGKMTVDEAKEIAGDLMIFNEENLPIPGVDASEASSFLDSFADRILSDNKDGIIEQLNRMGAQEEGLVWEQEGRSVKTLFGNPYRLVVELTGIPYAEAAQISPLRPLPFEDFSWFPADSLYRVKSYDDATVYEFADGQDYWDIPYCSINLVDKHLQAGTELDMLIGSHFFLTDECKIIDINGIKYIVSKTDEANIAIGAIAQHKGNYYYCRLSIPFAWLDSDDLIFQFPS